MPRRRRRPSAVIEPKRTGGDDVARIEWRQRACALPERNPGTRLCNPGCDSTKLGFERHIDYMHFNPVKHGLAARVCDWPYSSFHRYVRRGLLPHDWGGDFAQDQASFGERGS
jgi:hypothetical protein